MFTVINISMLGETHSLCFALSLSILYTYKDTDNSRMQQTSSESHSKRNEQQQSTWYNNNNNRIDKNRIECNTGNKAVVSTNEKSI